MFGSFRRQGAASIPTATEAGDRSRRLADQKEAALLAGGGALLDCSNVAPGTMGYALYALEMDGLATMHTERVRLDPITWSNRTTFTLTPAGERAAAMLREPA